MKLLLILIQDDDRNNLMDELKNSGYRATVISSTEDFLNYGETILLLGVEDEHCETIIKKLKRIYKKDARAIHGDSSDKVFIYVMDTAQFVAISSGAPRITKQDLIRHEKSF